jgi:hypothetical protein
VITLSTGYSTQNEREKRAEQVRERAEYAHDYVSKQRTLKLAKRYDQMANVAEERAKKHGSNRSP